MRRGGASPEDGGPTPLIITRRDKGVKIDGDQTGCWQKLICSQNQ